MEEALSSLGLSEKEFITDEQKFKDMEAGVSVCSKNIWALAKEIGFVLSAKSFLRRYQYTSRLWRLREVKILQILTENYAAVPRWTISKVCAWFLKTFPISMNLLKKRESALKKKLIRSAYSAPTINNK